VELPKSHDKSVESKSDPIIMTVDKDGNYFLKVTKDDKLQAYSPEEISARLKAMVAEQGEDKISVMLAAPGDADYQKVITATALLSESGVKKVGLVSQPGGTGGNAR
jgi:biopolymer transport protein TolR